MVVSAKAAVAKLAAVTKPAAAAMPSANRFIMPFPRLMSVTALPACRTGARSAPARDVPIVCRILFAFCDKKAELYSAAPTAPHRGIRMKRKARPAKAEAVPQTNLRVLPLVRSQLPMLPGALTRIGKYVLENPDLVIHQSA